MMIRYTLKGSGPHAPRGLGNRCACNACRVQTLISVALTESHRRTPASEPLRLGSAFAFSRGPPQGLAALWQVALTRID